MYACISIIRLLPYACTGTFCLADGRRFEGMFVDDYATLGAYTDERGARFTVEMRDRTYFSKVVELGDAAFKSKIPLQAVGR